MKLKKLKLFGLLVMIPWMSTHADNTEHIVWQKTPLAITLPIKKERVIVFPQAVSVIDSKPDASLHVMKVQDALYLKAEKAFKHKRLVVQLMPDGEVMVLNLSAKASFSDENPIEVLLERKNSDEGSTEPGIEEPSDNTPEPQKNADLNPVSLTRFAIQSLYSPARLLSTPYGIGRTPMRTHKTITLVYGASVLARPLISWKGGDYYVTAIELKNGLNKPIVLDPRKLIGHWQTAAFYPTNTLQARGHADTSTVFVVSDRPFGEALTQTTEFVR